MNGSADIQPSRAVKPARVEVKVRMRAEVVDRLRAAALLRGNGRELRGIVEEALDAYLSARLYRDTPRERA